MSTRKYICSGCGFTYEETSGAMRTGMPPKTPFDILSDDWRCPNCNAPKSMFHPSAPLILSPQGETASAEDAITQLQVIAEHAKKSFSESKSFIVPVDYLGEQIHELAIRVSGKPTIAERRMLTVFFSEAAVKLLRERAVNYYWFWRIVAQAASKASKLPMDRQQVETAIGEIRASFAQHLDLEKALPELDQTELALRVVYGLVVLTFDRNHRYSLLPNPLFKVLLSDTELAFRA